jgi:pantoate--beta-alanine ligase
MHIARTLVQLRAARAALLAAGRPGLALVPTMGALHEGHLSLLRAAQAASGAVAASIFVNPTQFAAGEDFNRYPRDEAADCAMLEAAGCDLVWLPDVATMYPPGDATTIDVGGPALLWEGAQRPGHFSGVATVVTKLLGQVQPNAAYFGEKDWQQVQVIRRFVNDLALPVQIVACPTWREPTGLAMSSRNRYLAPSHQLAAPALFAALEHTRDQIHAGVAVADAIAAARTALIAAGFTLDYLDLIDPETMNPVDHLQKSARLIAAARLGATRLLDNITV